MRVKIPLKKGYIWDKKGGRKLWDARKDDGVEELAGRKCQAVIEGRRDGGLRKGKRM